MTMNGNDIKKAAINKAKQVASAANNATNGNGGKKRRKGQDLKPIITTEGQQGTDLSPNSSAKMNTTRSVRSSDCMAQGISAEPSLQRQCHQLTSFAPESAGEQIFVIGILA